MAANHTIGIDFGTSTTLVAEGVGLGRPAVVPIGHSTAWMPSVASEDKTGLIVAEEALTQHPGRLITSVKRAITERLTTVSSPDASVEWPVDDVVEALLVDLAKRSRAERLPIGNAGDTRLGCPAMWDAEQRLRLLGLAENAGFAVGPATLIDEPIAAGLSWIESQTRRGEHLDEERVLVFDMGGGTLDVALLDVTSGPGRSPQVFVLASDGVNEAGDALDGAIAEDLALALAEHGVELESLPSPRVANAFVRRAAATAKVELTDRRSVDVEFGYPDVTMPVIRYSVEQLEEALRPQLERAWELVVNTLKAAYLARRNGAVPSDLRAVHESCLTGHIAHVLMVGGMSRIPAVASFLGRKLPSAKVHTFPGGGPQEIVASGLAESSPYEQVNLHRPAFDFVLEFEGADGQHRSIPLYRAHTKFYEPWEAMQKSVLRYEWPGGITAVNGDAKRFLPTRGYGTLSVFALDGTPVELRESGKSSESLRVNFGASQAGLYFTLAPDGRMVLRDSRGDSHSLRVTRWPALGSGFAKLALPVEEAKFIPERRRSWDSR